MTRGRPKLTEEIKRKVYPLRISDAERASYEQAAQESNLTLPKWIRTILTNATKK